MLRERNVAKVITFAIIMMGSGVIRSYANSPAPANYREYAANIAFVLVLAALFTAAVEITVAAFMKMGPKWVVFLTNMVTNLTMNLLLGYLDFTFHLYLRGIFFPVLCVFEILVLAAEYGIYRRWMGKTATRQRILEYTAYANLCSFLLGVLILQMIGLGIF